MKTFSRFLIVILILGLGLTSCSKDEDTGIENSNNNPAGDSNSLTCKVDGVDWSATHAIVASRDGSVVSLTGSDSNAGQCYFNINNALSSGTFTLGGSLTIPNNGRWSQGINPQTDIFTSVSGSGEGSVEIIELSDVGFKGTFYFTAKNMNGIEVSITDGSFSATFE